MNVLYNTVSIDQIGYSSLVVQISDRLAFIGNKRERYAVFSSKFLVGLNGVVAYTQHLGVEAFKAFDVFLEGLQFAF